MVSSVAWNGYSEFCTGSGSGWVIMDSLLGERVTVDSLLAVGVKELRRIQFPSGSGRGRVMVDSLLAAGVKGLRWIRFPSGSRRGRVKVDSLLAVGVKELRWILFPSGSWRRRVKVDLF